VSRVHNSLVRQPAVRSLFLVVVGLGALAAAIRWLPDVSPDGDFALIDLNTLNVIRDGQGVGVPSRFGWHHPGPLYLQVLAPLYVLTGFRHFSTVVTMVVLNTAVIAWFLLVIRRHTQGLSVLILAIGLLAAYVIQTWGLLASAWNPHVGLLSLALLIVLAAGAVAGDRRLLPAAAAVASFVAQAHLAFAPTAAIVTGIALITCAAEDMRKRRLASFGRPLLWTAAVVAVLWAMPALDAVAPGRRHNVQRIAVTFGDHPPSDGPSRRRADRAFAQFFATPFSSNLHEEWRHRPAPASAPGRAWAQTQGAALLAATVVWWFRRRRFEAALGLLTFLAAVGAWVSVRQIPEAPAGHPVYWVSIIGLLGWIVTLALPLDVALGRLSRSGVNASVRRWALAIAVGVVASCGAWQAVERFREDRAKGARASALTVLILADLNAVNVRNPRIAVSHELWPETAGVVHELVRDGFAPTVVGTWAWALGDRYLPDGHEPLTIHLVNDGVHHEEFGLRSDARVVGSSGGIWIYAVRTQPWRAVPLEVVEDSTGNGNASVLTDGRYEPLLGRGAETGAVIFFGTDDAIVFKVPPGIAGLRLTGEADSEWRLMCRDETVGRVRLSEVGDGLAAANTAPTALPHCQQLSLSAISQGPKWLVEVSGLVAPTRPIGGGS
jgi:hypothetical protein